MSIDEPFQYELIFFRMNISHYEICVAVFPRYIEYITFQYFDG